MPGPAKGTRPSGRKKGTPNKSSLAVKERLAALGCDYIKYLALTVNNEVPCGVCRGLKKTKFQPHGSERFSGERTCQSCWGSGLERLTPKERADAASKLMDKCEPSLKAIDIGGDVNKPLNIGVRVEFVKTGG